MKVFTIYAIDYNCDLGVYDATYTTSYSFTSFKEADTIRKQLELVYEIFSEFGYLDTAIQMLFDRKSVEEVQNWLIANKVETMYQDDNGYRINDNQGFYVNETDILIHKTMETE